MLGHATNTNRQKKTCSGASAQPLWLKKVGPVGIALKDWFGSRFATACVVRAGTSRGHSSFGFLPGAINAQSQVCKF